MIDIIYSQRSLIHIVYHQINSTETWQIPLIKKELDLYLDLEYL